MLATSQMCAQEPRRLLAVSSDSPAKPQLLRALVFDPGNDNRFDSQLKLSYQEIVSVPPLPPRFFRFWSPLATPPPPIRSESRVKGGCLVIYALPGQLKCSDKRLVLFIVPAIAARAAIIPIR